ncbi:PHD and RING finger domain-containing protein 1 [Trichonephila clavipes]|uniref:PHD and RING finger domain-containing protein 1 n=1 Tax=Trichonephila clavipes TaxID=2585209 RepID=A0A8X6SKC7_TRICX|nr:PHD and RING finger domain-containing protein 1 [Trichonephila clavipes]
MASSEDSNLSTSDEEVVRPVVKRKKKPKTIVSTSESEDEDSDIEIKPKRIGKKRLQCESEDENNDNEAESYSSSAKNVAESANDLSDNEQAEKCAICLSKFLGQDIATPETCDHVFCLECLQEWAKNVNTCPIDRLKFNLILIRHHKEEKIVKTIVINNSMLPSYSDSDTEPTTHIYAPGPRVFSNSAFELYDPVTRTSTVTDCCDLCGRNKNEGANVRCHECRKFYHRYCVPPAFNENSSSDTWKCPSCENSVWNRYIRRCLHTRTRLTSVPKTIWDSSLNTTFCQFVTFHIDLAWHHCRRNCRCSGVKGNARKGHLDLRFASARCREIVCGTIATPTSARIIEQVTVGSTSACCTILQSSLFVVAPDPVFRAWAPSRVHCSQQFLTAHSKQSTWPATLHVDQPAVFIPMIRPLSNSLNCEKCLLARLPGMFRLPKSSYNQGVIVTFMNLRICAGLYSTLFLIVAPPRHLFILTVGILEDGGLTPQPIQVYVPNSLQVENSEDCAEFLYPKTIFRRFLSSSDSSDEETEHRSVSSRLYPSSVLSSVAKSRCPLLGKRRNEICRSRNQALVSAAASAASESRTLYTGDSDEGFSDFRASSAPAPENFDVVGSILESQTLLHRPDILTVRRDGTLLRNSINGSSPRRLPNSLSPLHNSDDSSQSSFLNSSTVNDNTISPFLNNVAAKQRPLNPTQNNSSKYSETPMQAYSCSSSGAPTERSMNYDDNVGVRPVVGANSSDRFGNEPCSPIVPRSFCSTSTSENLKKDGRISKGGHSEDEVDIYSDIESVGEEDGVINERVEPMKIAFKCDDSQMSNPNDGSDSSDNELVIDEDQQVEDDNERGKEHQEQRESNLEANVKNSQVTYESEESNVSSNVASDDDQLMIDTNPQNVNNSFLENSNDGCYKSGDESSQDAFQNDESNQSKLAEEKKDIPKNESDCEVDPPKNESDSEVYPSKNESDSEADPPKNESDSEADPPKNESDSEADPRESDVDMQEDENSVDSTKKSDQGDDGTPCPSVKSSPKSCRGETTDGFDAHCDNSISNENSGYCDNNSGFGESKEVFDEMSNMENENTCDSTSQTEETVNFLSENNSLSQVEGNENFQNENNSNLSFSSDQPNTEISESEVFNDSSAAQGSEHNNEKSELVDICNEITMKSDDEDNFDSLENASTPCLDENLDGQIENSPLQDENYDDEGQDFEAASPINMEYEHEKQITDNEEKTELEESEPTTVENFDKDQHENAVDLGIEDISEAGSEEVGTDKNVNKSVEKKVTNLLSPNHDAIDIDLSKKGSVEYNKQTSSHSNQSFEDQEEGEIIEERPVHRCKKKKDRYHEDGDYVDFAPRINISDLPRIPKLKRDRDKDSIPETISFENKRTSVLSRVDLGNVDISWKRLSKHTRERSYRDGRPKDERLLYRERESRNKEKNETSRKSDTKNSERRRDEKKSESEKSKNDYDSRSRKSEKSKSGDWGYSDREKRKSRKEKHSKDKHSKEKKDKHDKSKHSKEDDKYEREKLKEDMRYDRDLRYDKEERFERIVYEKGKFKDKEHKSKHKDRKSESSKSTKDHSREKHKHGHSSDHFSDKQREREVRKIDDKLKIVVEQKESRKEKSKHKERKETKHEKKQLLQRKIETERSPYTELTSIESKEIFAKGDSIIINVNFNRASSPKVSATPDGTDSKDKKAISDDIEIDEPLSSDEIKIKPKPSGDKVKSSLDNSSKRPVTPPEKNTVLSVSESYWQGGDDPDGNTTPTSEKSEEETGVENDNETGSANGFDANNFSNSCSSPDIDTTSAPKESNSTAEESSFTPDKEVNSNLSKENESFNTKRRSPRSPSPPSPADNDSYDPCEPTRSPSPPPMPPAPPLPTMNPKPPPSPELPPLPPEPEPVDTREDLRKQNTSTDFATVSTAMVSSAAQPNTVHTQTSMASPISVQSILLPPPSFLSRVSSTTNNLPGLPPLVPPRNGGFQMGNHAAVMLPSNHVQQVMGGGFMPHIHGNSALPPPPNPPSMPHLSSVPPPPPPPAGMTLLSQARHPQLNIQPPLTPNSLLQSLNMAHSMAAPMQVIHHLPPNLSGILANHQSPIVCSAQNQPTSLSVSLANQQVSRMVFSQNQILNHNSLMQNQNTSDSNKSQGSSVNLMSSHTQPLLTNSSQLKTDKLLKRSPSAEKNEVVDMDVDTPYSPGDSPSVDSPGGYSPTTSPIPSSPKGKDVFDSLFPIDQRTLEKRTHDEASANEKLKHHSASKKSKHEHKSDSKTRHSVRMQVKDKYKKAKKEHKGTDKKEVPAKLEDSQLKILDELPSSAVEMQVKEKFLKKLNRQERVVEEVKLALKPYYKSRDVTKEEYKDILRKSVPKICHNKSGEINPVKVKNLVECYVKKAKHSRKKNDKKKSSKFS